MPASKIDKISAGWTKYVDKGSLQKVNPLFCDKLGGGSGDPFVT